MRLSLKQYAGLPGLDEAQAAPAPDGPSFLTMADLQMIPTAKGVLGVAEVSKQIGFPVHRAYFLRDVPAGEARGAHAHRNLRQCFIALRGSVTLTLVKQGLTQSVRLGATDQAAVVDRGCWRDLSDFSPDADILVLASDEYDEADYIRDRKDFDLWEAGGPPATSAPYLDLARYAHEVGPQIELAMRRVVRSGRLIGGPEVDAFEASFADYCEAPFAVGLGNGMDALTLALRAWNIGPGDEVIAPAHTFIATALAVDAVGATVVLVDVEPDTGLIDVTQVAAAITPRTRAIIPVHLYGHPADMDGLRAAMGERDDIRILEDACQAHGARYKGQRVGGLGDAAAFSFYPTKNLGALGDGGALVTLDERTAQTARKISCYGCTEKYVHELMGVNSRLDPLQAAALGVKLERLDGWNARRSALALRYFAGLSDLTGLALPAVRPWAQPVWHVFPVRVAHGRRDALAAWLAERNVGTNIHYPTPVHLQPCYDGRWSAGDFPVAEALANSVLSLPLDPTHTDAEIRYVIEAVRGFFE